MSTEANKQVVQTFINCMQQQDYESLETLLDDEFQWVVPSRSETLAGLPLVRDKQFTLQRIRDNRVRMKEGMRLTPFAWTAEGDRVAVEAEGTIVWESGKVYNNLYHLAFVLRGGRILKFTEYCDFLYAWETNPLLQNLGRNPS